MSVSSIAAFGSYHGQLKLEENRTEDAAANTPAEQEQSKSSESLAGTGAAAASLSVEALFAVAQVSQQTTTSNSYYEQFYPSYEGLSITNLAAAIKDPGSEVFSQNRSLADVAEAARASMDARLEQMHASGVFGQDSHADRNATFGELDRRALFAVSSNEGGLFTQSEQEQARWLMQQQQALAMGYYWGPISLKSEFLNNHDHLDAIKLSIQFLDQVSADEKTSVMWAYSRAGDEHVYDLLIAESDEERENFTSDSPAVQLIKAALDARLETQEPILGVIVNDDDLKNQPWFEKYADRLDRVLEQNRMHFGVS
ncbi:hypothetical protein PsAD2_04437 [Pseudovibrio axinellae]|uniref:Uncharacterized protein n=1 Tax=Pseudovibrio axinellae TaxID=989403 RepID=A0A165T2J6_9HYPH|nr:hypothetical protein [Pseudovibrio axinellae]KZL05226.1 hypothetical protein PsAD2_04437 [Pseudovibrio axinellae]SER31564.1 hypothetical protein SAMN05421798_10813 [Pseudovibrio axinellae]